MAAPSKLAPDTQGDAWEQRADESAKAYAAFCKYRALPTAERSIDAAWKKYKEGTESITPGYFRAWAAKNEWVARARAYDAYLDEQVRARFEADRLKQREQRQNVARALVGQLARTMQAYSGKDAVLAPSEINALAAAAAKVLNESRAEFNDLPTQRTLIGGIPDAEPVPISWVRVAPRGAGDSGGDAGNSAGG